MSRFFGFIAFLLFYIREIVVSNFRIAHDVLTPKHHMTPGIIAVDVADLSDRQVVLMANFITMTPGTLGLLVSEDRKRLYIHAMYIDDTAESLSRDLKETYGKRVKHVF